MAGYDKVKSDGWDSTINKCIDMGEQGQLRDGDSFDYKCCLEAKGCTLQDYKCASV